MNRLVYKKSEQNDGQLTTVPLKKLSSQQFCCAGRLGKRYRGVRSCFTYYFMGLFIYSLLPFE